jgi:hypothetical protein
MKDNHFRQRYSRFYLRPDYRVKAQLFQLEQHGILIGDASKFDDLIDYWNIRAAGVSLLFYDRNYESRLLEGCTEFTKSLSEQLGDKNFIDGMPVMWVRDSRNIDQSEMVKLGNGKQVIINEIRRRDKNRLNVKPVPVVFEEDTVIANTDEKTHLSTSTITFFQDKR